MTVYGVSFDLVGKQPIVLLKTNDGNTFLPIWIGHSEAAAILMNLQGTEPPRPMTHDLATSIIASLEGEIRQVTVTELRDSTFHALITIVRNGTEIELDARTSDAIALALRSDAKIFAADEVIEESGVEFEGDEEEASRRLTGQESLADLDPDEFRRFLDTVSPDEFAAEPEEDSYWVSGLRRTRHSPLSAELLLRQVEQVGHQAVEALGRERASVRAGELLAQAPLAIGIDGLEPELGLELPERDHELEPVVDGRHDSFVVCRDLAPDLVELLAHLSTTRTSASALKFRARPCPGRRYRSANGARRG